VPWRGEVVPWAARSFDALDAGPLRALLARWARAGDLRQRQRACAFPPPALLRPDRAPHRFRGDGHGAACRTYNVLVSEGRSVVAALLLERGREQRP
jgi:hypothetical protein